MHLYVSSTISPEDISEPTPDQVELGLRMLNGENCSEVSINHPETTLYIVGDSERVRIDCTSENPAYPTFIREGDELEFGEAIYPTLSNGEIDMLDYQDTVSITYAIEVCRYFVANDGQLPENLRR